jgi:hypothetical protein
MASTRNKNTTGDYCLEKARFMKREKYHLYKTKRTAYNNNLPCVGINVGYMPNNVLSWNSTQIESNLFGIGSTNLVKPKDSVHPRLKELEEIAFFERMNTYIPEPLAMEANQRPEIFRR